MDKLDYPIITGVMYSSDEDVDKWNHVLAGSGFKQGSILQEVSYDPKIVLDKVSIISESINDTLSKEGYKLTVANPEDKASLDAFISGIEEIPFWDIPFISEKEYKNDCDRGLVNLIVNNSSEICAANYSFIQGKNEYGWIAVDKKYRDAYGMSLVLIKAKVEGIISRGHMGRGWIDVNNRKSLRFHTSIGEELIKRYKKNYVLM